MKNIVRNEDNKETEALNVYHQALMEPFEKYRNGEITESEWVNCCWESVRALGLYYITRHYAVSDGVISGTNLEISNIENEMWLYVMEAAPKYDPTQGAPGIFFYKGLLGTIHSTVSKEKGMDPAKVKQRNAINKKLKMYMSESMDFVELVNSGFSIDRISQIVNESPKTLLGLFQYFSNEVVSFTDQMDEIIPDKKFDNPEAAFVKKEAEAEQHVVLMQAVQILNPLQKLIVELKMNVRISSGEIEDAIENDQMSNKEIAMILNSLDKEDECSKYLTFEKVTEVFVQRQYIDALSILREKLQHRTTKTEIKSETMEVMTPEEIIFNFNIGTFSAAN